MRQIILNPFETYSEKKLVLIGLISMIIGAFTAFLFHARYDGVLDLHFVSNVVWWQPLLDNVVNILVLTVVLYAVGKLLNAKTRLVDLLGVVMFSRIVLYLASVLNIGNYLSKASDNILAAANNKQLEGLDFGDVMLVMVVAFITLALLVMYLRYLFVGYKIACNAKGAKATWLFVIAILVSELFSKWLVNIY